MKFALRHAIPLLLLGSLLLTTLLYRPGLYGGFVFDDFPNVVDNSAVQPSSASVASLARAAMSSPSSELKRPVASLSFALNYLTTGMDPFGYKLTNLFIHLANGLLIYMLVARLLALARGQAFGKSDKYIAVATSALWLMLPINLTAVLYVVQRMESLANLCVLAGLVGYLGGRWRQLQGKRGHVQAMASVVLFTAVGVMVKETAIMLPMYALVLEFTVVRYGRQGDGVRTPVAILAFFAVFLLLPGLIGLAWLMPKVLDPHSWITKNFDLRTRLLSECRIVTDYIRWTLLPTASDLSFYHDDYVPSKTLFHPWTTAAGLLCLLVLSAAAWLSRRRAPVFACGIGLYMASNLLTGTVLPLELIYEHRNYFPSLGILLAIVPWLCAVAPPGGGPSIFPLARRAILVGMALLYASQTYATARAWGDPLALSRELAWRGPQSPRAQYELGRMYIIYSKYDPASPFTKLAYAPLERSALLPGSSILPEQALVFMNSRMKLPLKQAWWDSMIAKLRARPASVQDDSSLLALSTCAQGNCDIPQQPMVQAFDAAMSHPNHSARLASGYGDYAWNVLDDSKLGLSLTQQASELDPKEPVYHVTLARMYIEDGDVSSARKEIASLRSLNVAGSLNVDIDQLDARAAERGKRPAESSSR